MGTRSRGQRLYSQKEGLERRVRTLEGRYDTERYERSRELLASCLTQGKQLTVDILYLRLFVAATTRTQWSASVGRSPCKRDRDLRKRETLLEPFLEFEEWAPSWIIVGFAIIVEALGWDLLPIQQLDQH